jgi:hypothetical protein
VFTDVSVAAGVGGGVRQTQTLKVFKTFRVYSFILLFIGFLAFSSSVILLHASPALGAWAADALRGIFGDQAVASLETFVFQQEDNFHQTLQSLSLSSSNLEAPAPNHIQDARGQIVAEQSYFYPDAQRPYAQAVIVAFDLDQVRLHFVLGDEEAQNFPGLSAGIIPKDDLQSDSLVAIFNGGFKPRHGRFGIFINGVNVIPMRAELGTLGIYADGHIRIGQWGAGAEITPAPDLVAARQNGLLIIHQGEINPRLALDEVREWGYIVKNNTPTWRSGVGLNAEGDTLYYAAGPSLTLPALAAALQAAGAAQAIQLDVNQASVYYGVVQKIGSQLRVIPAFEAMPVPEDLSQHHFARDFFYVTSNMN